MNTDVRLQHPEYERAVDVYLNSRKDRLDRVLSNGRLTPTERTLIEARVLNRSGESREALARLEKIRPEERFLRAELHWVRSHCHHRLAEYELSHLEKLRAESLYRECQDRRGLFLCAYNLSVEHNRGARHELERHYLEQAEALMQGASEQVLVWRGQACLLSAQGKLPEAIRKIERALDCSDALTPLDSSGTRAVAADLYFQAGRQERALELLMELSRLTASADRARFECDRLLLKSLLTKELVADAGPAVRENPEYLARWQLVRAAQEGDRSAASSAFARLSAFFPEIFEIDLDGSWLCHDLSTRKSIFWSTLQAALEQDRKHPAVSAETQEGGGTTMLGQLDQILSTSAMPLRKEELIEQLWRCPYDPAMDSRFYKLVQRLKGSLTARSGRQVIVKNRAYRISRVPARGSKAAQMM
jgi:tetratricopeptide (TPR) repeat protein